MDLMQMAQRHFPNASPEEIMAFLEEIKSIVPTARDEDIISVANQLLTDDMSEQDKLFKLLEAAHKVADYKKQQKMAALQKKVQ